MTDKNFEAERESARIVLTRVFDAPRELVFKMWSDPKHFAQWYGPNGFTVPVCEIDLRPGGALRVQMRAPNGAIYPMEGTFTEVVAPERLAFATKVHDNEDLTTVTFVEESGKTRLTLMARFTKVAPEAEAMSLANMERGWQQTMDRLADHLGAIHPEEQIP
jgi:uncharacterized protein YndB with AHSA1/START domain